ncbi:MAG: hypothetical protein HQK79_14215 [Desulfobacterales bacterium]|nr:hypothetical protein [Desulfobacterales bacterium]
MAEVIIPYKPHQYQQEIHENIKRFSVIVAHRRFGKTVLCINHLLRDALCSGKKRYQGAYIAPLKTQAKRTAWDYFKYYARVIPQTKFNETELRADFINGARIYLLGADDPDKIRGMYLDGVILDEVAQMPATLWTTVISPLLADRKGWAIFIGTPRGYDHFHKLYMDAQNNNEWFSCLYKVSQTNVLDKDELSSIRKRMSDDEYQQEFECSFNAALSGAYYGKILTEIEDKKQITNVPYEPLLPVHTAWDLGVDDSTCIWFVQVLKSGEIRIIDYYEASGEGLPHYVNTLKAKKYVYGNHYAPHDIKVRELGTGKSRVEMAKELGIEFVVAPMLSVKDGIDAVRMMLPKCWIDSVKCAVGINALKQYQRKFNDKLNIFHDRPIHDWASHAADALRYFAVSQKEETKEINSMPNIKINWGFQSNSGWMVS